MIQAHKISLSEVKKDLLEAGKQTCNFGAAKLWLLFKLDQTRIQP